MSAAASSPTPRVVLVGLGPVSDLGVGRQDFEAWVERGALQRGIPAGPGGCLASFDVHDHVQVKTQCLDRSSGMAVAASALASRDAGWEASPSDATKVGLILGTAYGNATATRAYRELDAPSPLRFVHTLRNTPGGLTAQVLKLRGVHSVLCSGPLSSLQAMRYTRHLLLTRKADRVLCGGVDDAQSGRGGSAGSADRLPARGGAGVLAVVRGEDAAGNGYAEMAGAGVSCGRVADPSLFHEALQRAVASSGVAPQDLDAVVLGCADRAHAKMERAALRALEVPEDRWLDLAALVGDVGAAHGGLAAILAALLLRGPRDRQYVAVNGFHDRQCMSLVFTRTGG